MAKQNKNLLEEIYKATKMGLEATQLVIPKVRSASLREEIELQGENYKGMNAKAKDMLRKDGILPDDDDESMKDVMLRSAIRMSTLMNKNTSHIAEMMINGTTMGIIDMTKRLNELDDADAGAKKLAEDYIVNEQQNIENLKKHL